MTSPVVRVVRGEPTAEEIAALIAVLAAVPTVAAPTQRTESAWWRSGLPAGAPRSWRDGRLTR
jgi:hypothetical protein